MYIDLEKVIYFATKAYQEHRRKNENKSYW